MKTCSNKPVNTLLLNLLALVMIALSLSSCKKEEQAFDDSFPAIRIIVLNGCGFSGVASEMSQFLSKFNVDIVGIGNAGSFAYDKTIIVVKKDDPQDLERLKKYTNITRHAYALSDDTTEAFQIIVGRDYLSYIK